MPGRNSSHWPVRAGLAAVDLLALATSYFTAYYLRFWSSLYSTFKYVPMDYYLYAFPVVVAVFLAGFSLLGLYENRKPYSKLSIFLDSFKGVAVGTLLVLPLSFWFRSFSYSRWVVILNGALLLFLDPLLRSLYQRVVEDLRRRGRDALRLLIIGAGEQARQLVDTLEAHPELGYQIMGLLQGPGADDAAYPPLPASPYQGEEPDVLPLNKGELEGVEKDNIDGNHSSDVIQDYPLLGTLEDLVRVLEEHQIEEVVLADEGLDPQREFQILQPCRAEGVKIRVVPALYDFALGTRGMRVIDHLFWYSLEPTIAQRWDAFLKRVLDVVVSGLMLIPTALLFPVIALLIRLDSPGPVLFRQRRTGTNGRPFTMYKFRSMVAGAEEVLPRLVDLESVRRPAFKMQDDPRVTRVGRFLRRFSLDELPQFYNVLRGDMSLVGPRPEQLWLAEKYDEKERARLQVKPGITGFQQIRCRGSEDFDDRLRHDLYYIHNRSLLLDLSILLETLWVVLRGKGRH